MSPLYVTPTGPNVRVNVADYSSVQAAIIAALATNSAVYIPQGTWSIDVGGLTISSPIELLGDGPGSILQASDNSAGITITAAASGTKLRDFVLIGNNVQVSGAHGINSGGTGTNNRCSDVDIREVEIKNWGGKGINTGQWCQRWLVRGNRIHDNWDEGILVGQNCFDMELGPDNWVYGNGFNGIDVNASQTQVHDNVVHDNGNKVGITYGGSNDRSGILVAALGTDTLANTDVKDNTVYNNWLVGIRLLSAATSIVAACTVNDNTVFGSTSFDGILLDGSAAAGSMSFHTVNDNKSRSNGRWGIGLDGATDCVVGDNQCSGNASTGIQVQSTVACSRNHIDGNLASSNTGNGIKLLAGAGALTDNQVTNNTALNNAAPQINDGGTNTKVAGNNDRTGSSVWQASGAIQSTVVTGTAPLIVASATAVPTLTLAAEAQVTGLPADLNRIYSPAGAQVSSGHTVRGTATLASGTVVVTLSGSAVFSSSSSYQVAVLCNNNQFDTFVYTVVINSGSQFTIFSSSGTDANVVGFIAVGN